MVFVPQNEAGSWASKTHLSHPSLCLSEPGDMEGADLVSKNIYQVPLGKSFKEMTRLSET